MVLSGVYAAERCLRSKAQGYLIPAPSAPPQGMRNQIPPTWVELNRERGIICMPVSMTIGTLTRPDMCGPHFKIRGASLEAVKKRRARHERHQRA